MLNDINALKRKQQELQDLVSTVLPSGNNEKYKIEVANAILNHFIELSPPQEEEPRVHWISLSDKGRGGGYSRKAGNLILNWRNLFQIIPDVVLTGSGVVSSAWLWPFAGLHVWNIVWAGSKIELSKNHAVAIYSMWMNKDGRHTIDEKEAFNKTNDFLLSQGDEKIDRAMFAKIIDDLNRMECIELESGRVWLRESVRKTYD